MTTAILSGAIRSMNIAGSRNIQKAHPSAEPPRIEESQT
jgi:hypothetical protein